MVLLNFTLEDTSPVFEFQPYADGFGLQNGWQTFYTGSGFNSKPGQGSQGDSFHLTSLDGAQVALKFYGSAIYLYGTTNSSYDITLDNEVLHFSESPAADLLYSNVKLPEETHHITLIARPSSQSNQLGLKRAIITSESTGTSSEKPLPLFFDNSDSALTYSGQWSTSSVAGIPNSSVTAPFHQTLAEGASVSMNFS
ncbi:hypothetical protein C8J57DRAFT_1469510, partial [Mycena rebaudengoi]